MGYITQAGTSALWSYLNPMTSPLVASLTTALPLFNTSSPIEHFTLFLSWNSPGPPQSGMTNDHWIDHASMACRAASFPFGSMPVIHWNQPTSGWWVALQSGGLSCYETNWKVHKYIVVIHLEPVHHFHLLGVGHFWTKLLGIWYCLYWKLWCLQAH